MSRVVENHCTACGHRWHAVAPLGCCPRCHKTMPAPGLSGLNLSHFCPNTAKLQECA